MWYQIMMWSVQSFVLALRLYLCFFNNDRSKSEASIDFDAGRRTNFEAKIERYFLETFFRERNY